MSHDPDRYSAIARLQDITKIVEAVSTRQSRRGLTLSSAYAAATTPIEQQLTLIWQEVLHVDVGVDDNFFELGGDSLKLVQIVARIQRRWGDVCPVEVFFDQPTIRQLGAVIASALE